MIPLGILVHTIAVYPLLQSYLGKLEYSEKITSGLDTQSISLEQQLEKEINNSEAFSTNTNDAVEGYRYLSNQPNNTTAKISCNKCGAGCSTMQMLKEHRKAAHSFMCQYCKKSFLSKQSMSINIKNVSDTDGQVDGVTRSNAQVDISTLLSHHSLYFHLYCR